MKRRDRRRLLAYEVQRLSKLGNSQRSIARSLRISRNTVGELLDEVRRRREEGETALEFELGKVRAPRPSKLDEHEDRIRGWIKDFPKLRATRLLEMLEKHGFKGGYTIVREKLRELKSEIHPASPAVAMSYAPGQRCEYDWSPYKLLDSSKVNLWNATLSWSRGRYLEASRNTKQMTILTMLRLSFESWGGVPDECLTDSMPGVVDRWELEEPVLNVRYVDFAAHYGFTALTGQRGCPKAKARAERLYRFHEENCLNGRHVHNFEEYAELVTWWCEHRAMAVPHPETGRPVAEMVDEERRFLKPLPRIPYDTRDVVVALIDRYGYAQFETNQYPVPAPVGSRVYVCADRERVEICDPRAKRLFEHERLPFGAHIRLEQPSKEKAKGRYDVDELVERIGAWDEAACDFAQKLREQRRYAGPELVEILGLQVSWSLDSIVTAMRHAHDFHCYRAATLRRILEAHHQPRSLGEQIASQAKSQIEQTMRAHPVPARDVGNYACLRNGDRRPKTREEGSDAAIEEEAV